MGFLGLIPLWAAGLNFLSRHLSSSILSSSDFQAERIASASAKADWSSSVERREGFLSRARRVSILKLRSGKGVRSGKDVAPGSEVVASAVMGEYLDGGEEMNASAVLRGVSGGEGVLERSLEEVLARIPAKISTPIAEELGVVVVVAKLAIIASVFSPDMFALFEKL